MVSDPELDEIFQRIADRAWAAAKVRPVHKKNSACRQGHPFTEENTKIRTDGYRECQQCRAVWKARRRVKRQGKRDDVER